MGKFVVNTGYDLLFDSGHVIFAGKVKLNVFLLSWRHTC
jgi:hypothetical protein